MKFYIYGLKNRLLGTFESPVSSNIEGKDYIEGLALTLAAADIGVLARYQEYDVYQIGVFDSVSGELVASNEFVSSLEPLCVRLIEHKSKGDKEDVREKSN